MQLSTTLVHRRDVTIKPPTPRAHGTQVSYPLWPLVQRTPCYDDAAQVPGGEPARHMAPIPSLIRPLCSVVVLLATCAALPAASPLTSQVI